MDDLEKFNKHIGKPVTIKIEGDEFEFKPLNYEQFGKLIVFGGKYGTGKDFDTTKLGEQGAEEMMGLFVDIVKTSYPELDQEKIDSFVVHNLEALGNLLEKLMPETKNKDIDKIKKRIQKNGPEPTQG